MLLVMFFSQTIKSCTMVINTIKLPCEQRFISNLFFMKWILPISLFVVVSASCKKEQVLDQPGPPPVSDARSVLLNEVVEQSLPSPYYKFVYDAEKYVTEIKLASGLYVYQVSYENRRVKKLSNHRNGHQLLYSYSGEQVTKIDEQDSLRNRLLMRYEFQYNVSGKLVQINWRNFTEVATGKLYKQTRFAYGADENLARLETYLDSAGTWVLAKTQLFSNYDAHTNVDDFSMLQGHFDAFLYLPQVKMQLNNAGLEKIITAQNDFEITYSYQYNNNHQPVSKTGVMIQTRGGSTGQFPFQFTNRFSYY